MTSVVSEAACANARPPIAKIPVEAGVALSRSRDDVAYEWFYAEIFSQGHHVVLIFMLADPFHTPRERAPAALYAVWHEDERLLDYAYALLEGEAGSRFRSDVMDFFEGKAPTLRVAVPSHDLAHDVAVWLEWADAKGPTAAADERAFHDHVRTAAVEGVKHVWQPLALGRALRGRIFRSHGRALAPLPENRGVAPLVSRVSAFHDLPLAGRLARSAKRARAEATSTVHAIKGDLRFGPEAWCYVDHNAGLEPLSLLPEPWFWWHLRDGDHAEIGYWFPRTSRGYRCTPGVLWEVSGFGAERPVVEPAITAFGVRAARAVRTRAGGVVRFGTAIEAAPFYARFLSADAHLRPATLEALAPARLDWPFCRGLMGARKVRARVSSPSFGSADFLATCRKVTQAHGRSFYLSSHVLPERSRAGAYFVYTLCRLIDDATDESDGAGAIGSAAFLDAIFGASTTRATTHAAVSDAGSPVAFVASALASCGAWDAVDAARAAAFLEESRLAAAAFGLERRHFEELVEGQRMDEAHVQPADFALCYLYCFRVAGVVGLLMARILGARASRETLEAAEHLGIAMQLTNILRDVREDWEGRGRVYLPADACHEAGVAFPTVLREPTFGAEDLVRSLGRRAVGYYGSAMRGVEGIPTWRARLCVKLMTAVYGAILGVILASPRRAFEGRVVIPVRRRLWLAAQVLLGRDPLRVAGMR